ncbi:hypothetical protein EV702DRAFT_1042671 [Suillus placidus]|uniref:F-box domain-containing protein n=1 Tax=Suillus placidus TaxID=48579 RepID=A0A9P7A3X0_9AGAM|nr:hypothetical protein EV702DRAFT_1042671 [Suillus placidus]
MTLSVSVDVNIPRSKTVLVEQCGARIDEDTIALSESVRTHRSRRNALVYVSRLPPEILANIFMYIVSKEESYMGTSDPRGAPACLAATHVCRYWRQVALECPILWAFIDGVSAQWLAIMLERSKKAALVVIYNDPQPLRQCGFEKILSHLPRITFLQLCPSPPEANRILDSLSSLPAPLLHTFKFVVFGDPTFARPISDTIFQGQAPQLRSVQLVQCCFSWTSCIFTGLHSLHIGSSPKRSPLSQILSALRRMPELELLTLEPRSSEQADALLDQVSLPRLRRIELFNSTIHTATSLFSHLVLPVDARVVLSLTKIESVQSFADLFSAMHKNHDESVPIIRSLRVSLLYSFFTLRFSTSIPEHPWTRDSDIRLSITFLYSSWITKPDILFDICRTVPHCKIQHLAASFSGLDAPEEFWRTGSAELPELESIHLDDTPIQGFLTVLLVGDGQSSYIAYPSLRTLEFENIHLGCGERLFLEAVLMLRAGCGVGIHTLRLAKCRNLMGKIVERLQTTVAVDWDGHEDALADTDGGCLCPSCDDNNSEYYDFDADALSGDLF